MFARVHNEKNGTMNVGLLGTRWLSADILSRHLPPVLADLVLGYTGVGLFPLPSEVLSAIDMDTKHPIDPLLSLKTLKKPYYMVHFREKAFVFDDDTWVNWEDEDQPCKYREEVTDWLPGAYRVYECDDERDYGSRCFTFVVHDSFACASCPDFVTSSKLTEQNSGTVFLLNQDTPMQNENSDGEEDGDEKYTAWVHARGAMFNTGGDTGASWTIYRNTQDGRAFAAFLHY